MPIIRDVLIFRNVLMKTFLFLGTSQYLGHFPHCHRQNAECEAQMEGDGVLPHENVEYAPLYALSRWGVGQH
jgi:hypothetical protein